MTKEINKKGRYSVNLKEAEAREAMHTAPIDVNKIRNELPSWFKRRTGEDLNLDHPKTFNEKIQWLKLYDSTPIKTRLADKYLVRDWVKEKIGDKYLIPLLGVYDHFEDIDFDSLPDRFVIKCNHGSAWNIIVKDKSSLDLEDAKTKIDAWVKADFSSRTYELHYRDIPSKIIIEKYLYKTEEVLYEYHFYCFSGCVEQIWLDINTVDDHKRKIYDRNWNELDMVVRLPRLETDVPKPYNLDVMLELAEKLSDGFAHVRVDFYRLDDGTIYFGEMTFTPASGTVKLPPSENVRFGSLIKLPELAYDIDSGVYYNEKELRFFRSQFAYDYEKIIEEELESHREQLRDQLHDQFREAIDNITENKLRNLRTQLIHDSENITERKLSSYRKQLILDVKNITERKLSSYRKQLILDVENITERKLSSYRKQLILDVENITKRSWENSRGQIEQMSSKQIESINTHQDKLYQREQNFLQSLDHSTSILRKELRDSRERERKTLREFFMYRRNKRFYRRYKILSYITFGKLRCHYKQKAMEMKLRIREVRNFLKSL